MKTPSSSSGAVFKTPLFRAAIAGFFCLLLGYSARAQTLYWNAASGSSWATAANWSTDAAGLTPSASIPSSSDNLIFNSTPFSSTANQVMTSADITAHSLTFAGTSTMRISQTNVTKSLTLGTGGITVNSGSGAINIGESTGSLFTEVTGDQTWANNSDQGLNVRRLRTSNTATGDVAVTLSANGAGAITFSNSIGDSADGTKKLSIIIDSAGTGSVSLLASTWSGGTIVKRGVLSSPGFGTGNVLLGDTVGSNDARINLTGVATNNITVQPNTGSGLTALTGSGSGDFQGTIAMNRDLSIGSVSGSPTTIAFSGAISGTGNLKIGRVATGTSNPTVTVTGANSYTGKTTIESATVVVNSLKNVGGGSSSLGAPTTIANGTITMSSVSGSTLRYTGTGDSTDRVIEIASSIANTVTTLDQSGTGNLLFTANMVNSGTGNRGLTLQGSTAGTGEISGVIPDAASFKTSITKSGTGTWRLSGNNTYTGATQIGPGGVVGGVLEVTSLKDGGVASSLGMSTNAASNMVFGGVTTAGTLRYVGTGDSTDRRISVGGVGGILDASGTGATGTINFTNGSGPTWVTSNVPGLLTFTGTNTTNNTFAGAIGNPTSSTTTITKSGAGTWAMTGTNTYTGATTVSAGTLLISGSGSLSASSAVSVTGGTFKYDSSVALGSNVTVNGGRFSYNSAANYAGALTFTSGTVGGSNLSGVALNIGTGQVMAPGNSTGTLAAGATTWANGGTFVFELNNATGTAGSTSQGWDLLNASTLDVTAGAGQFTLQIVSLDTLQAAGPAQNFSNGGNYSWLFVDAGAPITGFSAGKFVLDATAFQNTHTGNFTISQGTGINDDKLYLNYSAIPEPSTWALLAFSLTTVMVLRRRRE